MTLSATDSGGAAVDKTYYTTGASPADPTTASDVYNPAPGQKPGFADGERIKYFSTDTVGNAEAVRTSATAQVDLSAPTTTDDVPAETVVGAPVEVTLSATDSGGAAVDKTYYTTGASPADPTTALRRLQPPPPVRSRSSQTARGSSTSRPTPSATPRRCELWRPSAFATTRPRTPTRFPPTPSRFRPSPNRIRTQRLPRIRCPRSIAKGGSQPSPQRPELRRRAPVVTT